MLLALLLALQETGFRLQDRVPDDCNLFVEIDGVAALIEAAGKGGAGELIGGVAALVESQLDGRDPFSDLGFDPIALARQARGQLAFAGRYRVDMDGGDLDWIVAVDFGDEKPALEAMDGIGDRATARREGAVVFILKDAALLEKAPERPLSADARFKRARELARAGAGRIFGYADLEPLTKLIDAIPEPAAVELLREAGAGSVLAYVLGAGVEKDAVDQVQILMLDEKPDGMLGELARLPVVEMDLTVLPDGAAAASRLEPGVVKALGEFYEMVGEVLSARGMPFDLGALGAALGEGKRPHLSGSLLEDGKTVAFNDMDDPKAFVDSMAEIYAASGIGLESEEDGDLEVYRFTSDIPELEPMLKAQTMAVAGNRLYQGGSVEAMKAVHKKLVEGAYGKLSDSRALAALVGDRKLAGGAFIYIDGGPLTAVVRNQLEPMAGALPPEFGALLDGLDPILKKVGVGYDLLTVRDGHLVLESRSQAGLTIGGTAWVGVAAAVAVPAMVKAVENAKTTLCSANLRQLIMTAYNHSITKVEPEGSFVDLRGHAFWERIATDEEMDAAILRCPDTGRRYRGPAQNPNLMASGEAIGACVHEDVVVWVAKSGDVHRTPVDSPTVRKVLESTVTAAGWSGAGARLTYRPEGDGKPMTLEIKAVDGNRATVEWSGEGIPTTREVLLSRPDGVRVISREIDGKAIALAVDEEKLRAALRAIRSDDAGARDVAVGDLAALYPAARETIERELGGDDPELGVRLMAIRDAASAHYPVLVAYPLKPGSTWSNAYGSSFEVVGREEIETGEGREPAWRIRVTQGEDVREMWWSDDLNAFLAVRGAGGGWVLESVTPGR